MTDLPPIRTRHAARPKPESRLSRWRRWAIVFAPIAAALAIVRFDLVRLLLESMRQH
ncbi:hypothetical protein [Phenylobacterium deserti]|uniref:hypothetical protein n=1 Tax=Phenylobacterium deserti TaxID=1914756 RepID=UPI001401DE1D|nr:hypothetical protein [Phenylobacterium deserti]